jgi:hypothetical protein
MGISSSAGGQPSNLTPEQQQTIQGQTNQFNSQLQPGQTYANATGMYGSTPNTIFGQPSQAFNQTPLQTAQSLAQTSQPYIPTFDYNVFGQPQFTEMTPEIGKQLGVLTGIRDFDEQGNRMAGGVPNLGVRPLPIEVPPAGNSNVAWKKNPTTGQWESYNPQINVGGGGGAAAKLRNPIVTTPKPPSYIGGGAKRAVNPVLAPNSKINFKPTF